MTELYINSNKKIVKNYNSCLNIIKGINFEYKKLVKFNIKS